MQIQTLPLSAITRISPTNPRRDEDDVSQLAATIDAAGLQYPLLVLPRPDVIGEYEVIDGGRRWRALKAIADDSREVPVEIHEGDESTARLAALAVAVTPRALHPVAEFEAFARMIETGLDIAAIAKSFALTERHVRQRLALGSLAEPVRDMWRKGEISRESAEAYASGSVEAQEAIVENWRGTNYAPWLDLPYEIRKALRGDVMPEYSPVSRFILRDAARVRAYVEAGGRTTDDLFQPAQLRDAPIAEKIADELLRAEAGRIAREEGWGRGLIEADGFDLYEDDPELTEEEEARLDEIAKELAEIEPSARKEELRAEEEKILRETVLRGFSAEERAELGVGAFLNHDGTVSVSRGVALPDDAATEPGGDAPESPPGESGEAVEADRHHDDHEGEDDEEHTPDPLAEPSSKALRAVIEAAATGALREVTRRRPDVAIVFAVAALGCQYDVAGLGLRPVHAYRETEENELLRRIRPLRFDAALAECEAAPNGDLTVALARLVASSIETQGAPFAMIGALCGAACARGADLKGAFTDALDRRGFFDAAGKARTLDMITAMIGAGEAKAHKSKPKDKVAEVAAHIARDKGFLPAPLSNWAAGAPIPHAADDAIHADENKPLAQAMAEAIAADEGDRGSEPQTVKRSRAPRKTPIEKAIAEGSKQEKTTKAAKSAGEAQPAKKAAEKSARRSVATKPAPAKKGARK